MANRQWRRWAAAWVGGLALSAQATVVTFEDHPAALYDGYGGISGWSAEMGVYPGAGESVGNYLLYGPQEAWLSFITAPVVFKGAYYKAYLTGSGLPDAAIELFYLGSLVHTVAARSVPLGLEWFASGYAGRVDRMHVLGGGEGFGLDDVTYDAVGVSPVPLPAAGWLFSSAIAVLGLWRRRRQDVV